MSKIDFINEIKLEIEQIQFVINELVNVLRKHENIEPDNISKTAAGSFLAQFYNGIENILKRIIKMRGLSLPKGETWHFELFKRFCKPSYKGLPVLFEDELEIQMNNYRKFRHIVHHGYSSQLKWKIIKEGIQDIEAVFQKFSERINTFIEQEL